jgi:hypothetical protein
MAQLPDPPKAAFSATARRAPHSLTIIAIALGDASAIEKLENVHMLSG